MAMRSSIVRTGMLALFGTVVAGCATRQPPARPPAETAPPKTSGSAPVDWPVPPEEAAKPNPLTANAENLEKGQELFRRHCTACHGSSGRGDGPIALQWARLPRDLTHPDRQARLSDGEMFYKISNGHRQGADVIMPGLSGRLSADDRWRIVLYVRTLRAQAAP
jgi:mono/diheme cytochrome c family protein